MYFRRPLFAELLESRMLLAADLSSADFNRDFTVDIRDVDLLVKTIHQTEQDQAFDLNSDQSVDALDLDLLIRDILGTRPGDTNLDGDVDFGDFLTLASNFGSDGAWSAGEADLVPGIDLGDFLALSEHFGYTRHTVAYTNHQTDGNRFVAGWGDMPNARPMDIELPFVPQWALGIPLNQGQIWVAVSSKGQVVGYQIDNGVVTQLDLDLDLPAGMPPAVEVRDGMFQLVPQPQDASSFSHPIRFGDNLNQWAYIRNNGDLVVVNEAGVESSATINALLDARILCDGTGRLLVLSDPTNELAHGVLGDRIEANAIKLVDTTSIPWNITQLETPSGKVVEGIAPIWFDVDRDGQREVIVTLSSATNGGQLVIFEEDGTIAAQEPGIGRGSRWRHQIAVAPMGTDRTLELTDVLTPHIGGVVEFRSLDEDLPLVGTLPGQTSHTIRSRNLDLAVAGDFDSDGLTEVLLPTQSRNRLTAVHRTAEGAQIDWQVDLKGILSTNIAVLQDTRGQLTVGVGRSDGVLRVFASS